ncbi:hypothetical protein GCM10023196_024070 [Actinoallomurus vinaceus]|uniref:Uncharacterized protein n=1 Tax=Actinoallomurus vinaceus TaxID=1080074 RepID=A0ABP8U8H0_9ACTN
MRNNIAGAAVNKAAEARPDKKVAQSAETLKDVPEEAVQGTAMKGLRLPVVGRLLQSLALARLLRVLRAIVRFIPRALPVAILIVAGWLFRRMRRK